MKQVKWYEFWNPASGPAGGLILGVILFLIFFGGQLPVLLVLLE